MSNNKWTFITPILEQEPTERSIDITAELYARICVLLEAVSLHRAERAKTLKNIDLQSKEIRKDLTHIKKGETLTKSEARKRK